MDRNEPISPSYLLLQKSCLDHEQADEQGKLLAVVRKVFNLLGNILDYNLYKPEERCYERVLDS